MSATDWSAPMAVASTTPCGRRVLLTGARGGIGRAIVAALTEAQCRVAGCDVPGSGAEFEFDVPSLALANGLVQSRTFVSWSAIGRQS